MHADLVEISTERKHQVVAHLLSWFSVSARCLPWRQSNNLYYRVVSEFMLQQTQVSTVIPYFLRWISTFPDWHALSAATEADVLKHWEGLGYYRRARCLHTLSHHLSTMSDVPASLDFWMQFPGIGRYTASAIVSIAQGGNAYVVDGNVIRVYSRLEYIDFMFRSKEHAVDVISPIACAYLPEKNISAFNESLMELGALVCTARRPRCDMCPLAIHCKTYQLYPSKCTDIPAFQKMNRTKKDIFRLLLLSNGKIWLSCSRDKRLYNIYELPELLTAPDVNDCKMCIHRQRTIANVQYNEAIYVYVMDDVCVHDAFDKYFLHKEWTDAYALSCLKKFALSGPHKQWIQEILLDMSIVIE